jgi:undecaprenyl-phosphate galactose phosphotransferase/UDP-galactose-lipid carrier transferase
MNMDMRNALLPAVAYVPSEAFPPAASRFKRLIDCVLCFLAMPAVLLIGLPVALLIMLDGGGPFFVQTRIGRGGNRFHCLKFRTMVPNAERKLQRILDRDPVARAEWERDFKLKNDPRVTLIGRFLRKTSLDELPQFLNVLAGEMSIVGPRPVTRQELNLYGDNAQLYLACTPGITGLWQVSGRNDVSYANRVALDVRYVLTWTPLQDIKIMFRTLPAMLSRRGAY